MKKDCKFCDKKGLMILPLRYSVAVADDVGKELGAIPAMPGHLGDGVKDLAIERGKYLPAMLREGYLYVLVERKGIKSWEGFCITEGAYLYKFSPETPPTTKIEFTCNPSSCGVDASMISIDKASDVEKLYLLFTPSPLTQTKLKEYKASPDDMVAKKKMQVFNPKAWLNGQKQQPHALIPADARKHTLEWMLLQQGAQAKDSPLGKRAAAQLFRPLPEAFTPSDDGVSCQFNRLEALASNMAERDKQSGAAAFVIYDHIGITQELNDFRNAPLEGLEHYLAATDEFGASNLHRLQVIEAIEEVRAGLEAGLIRSTEAFIEGHRHGSDQYFERTRNRADVLRKMGRNDEAVALERQASEGLARRQENYQAALEQAKADGIERWSKKYQKRLDTAEMKLFRSTFEEHAKRAFQTAELRGKDHLNWFSSDRLVSAFDAYDPKDTNSGYSFALQSAVCSIGMSGCKSNDAKLDAWIKAPSIERANLYMRGFVYNQADLIQAANQAFADIRAQAASLEMASSFPGKQMLSLTKGLVDGFKKIDSAFDEWVRNQGQEFSRSWIQPSKGGAAVGAVTTKALGAASGLSNLQKFGLEAILFHKASELTRTIFRTGLGGPLDKALTATLGGLVYARLGPLTEKLAFDELMLKIPPEKLAEGYKGRSADRNKEMQARHVAPKAGRVAAQVDDSLETLILDARAKVRDKVAPSLGDLKDAKNPPTNNYHQARLGILLGCIEMIALAEKISRYNWDFKSNVEVAGSALAVGGIVMDTQYSLAKSIREIEPYKKIKAIETGADIVRGGLKLGAGALSCIAGCCSAYLDLTKIGETKDSSLRLIYWARAGTGFVSAFFTISAALSYSRPYLQHVAKGYAAHSLRYRVLIGLGNMAGKIVARVRLLVWIARFNLAGLALTAAEIGYLALKDDALQDWAEKCVFRKYKERKGLFASHAKPSEHFLDPMQELAALESAAQEAGIR